MTLLHPPYTLWHLSYVAVGAALAPHFHLDRMLWALASFFLAMGIAAHALDELNGRPLRTQIPSPVLVVVARRLARGSVRDRGRRRVRLGLVAAGVRRRRRDASCPRTTSSSRCTPTGASRSRGARSRSLTGYFVEAQTLRLEAVAAAAYAFAPEPRAAHALDAGPRSARRKHATTVGTEPLERALRLLTWASVALAVALVAARLR